MRVKKLCEKPPLDHTEVSSEDVARYDRTAYATS